MTKIKEIGLIGARGHVGAELVEVLQHHPKLELVLASSTSRAGTAVPGTDLVFEDITPASLLDYIWNLDALVLALPNQRAAEWADTIQIHKPGLVVLDISADFRFDPDWVYGLPEINREALKGATRISNPGCYATAAQLALQPIRSWLAGAPAIFGVSGYSGAGATPNPRNDINRLADNLMPYNLVGHLHEQEISHQLGREVHFTPHVAQFFRGLSVTVQVDLHEPVNADSILDKLCTVYASAEHVAVTAEIPEVAQVRNTSNAIIGGVEVSEDGKRAVLVSVIDNLRKGAASQAIQNLELALLH